MFEPEFVMLMEDVTLIENNNLRFGKYNIHNLLFTPFVLLLPGEFYVLRLDKIQDDFPTTGSGTGELTNDEYMVKGVTAPVNCFVGAFES